MRIRSALAVGMLLAGAAAVPPKAGAQADELRAIAEAAMEARGQVLMGRSPEAALQGNAHAQQIRAAMAAPFQSAATERQGYQAAGLQIPRVESQVRVTDTRVEGERATVTANVQTTVHLGGVQGAPDRTVETMPHVFTYERRNGQWELVEDRVPDPFRQAVRDTFPRVATPALPGPSSVERNGPKRTPPRARPSGGGYLPPAVLLGTRTFGTLNPSAVVSYARSYALSYNSSYRDFNNSGTQGGDCTNFASQAMRAGGWPDVGGYLNRTGYEAWWYDTFTQTYTWVNAHYFYVWTSNNRASRADNVYNLEPGDVLQMDFDANGDIDHTTIVTKKDANGMIYLSYHTSNTLDKPFTTFQSQVSSSTRYYGHWLWYSF